MCKKAIERHLLFSVICSDLVLKKTGAGILVNLKSMALHTKSRLTAVNPEVSDVVRMLYTVLPFRFNALWYGFSRSHFD